MEYCRLCALINENLVSIFTKPELSLDIQRYLHIQVLEEDPLPNNICEICLNKIKELVNFVTNCNESQKNLYKLLFSGKTKQSSGNIPPENTLPENKLPKEIKTEFTEEIILDSIEVKADIELENKTDPINNFNTTENSSEFNVTFTLTIPELPPNRDNKPNSSISIRTNPNQLSTLLANGKYSLKQLGKKIYSKYMDRVREHHNIELKCDELKNIESLMDEESDLANNGIHYPVPGTTCYVEVEDSAKHDFCEENEISMEPNEVIKEPEQLPFGLKIPSIVLSPLAEIKNKSMEKKNKMLTCTMCPYQSLQKYRMNQHIREVHNKRFECEKCHKRFGKESKLKYHINSNHVDVTPLQCHFCNAFFSQRYEFKQHVKTHSSDDSWYCELCKINFSQQYKLAWHLSRYHKDKSEKCSRCSFVASHKYQLKQHVREVHLKPVECDICGKRESKKCRLIAHIKHQHMEKETYECDSCSTKYTSKKWFELHKNKGCPGKVNLFP